MLFGESDTVFSEQKGTLVHGIKFQYKYVRGG